MAQKKAVSAPAHDQVMRPPRSAGSSRVVMATAGNQREIVRRSLSAAMSGAYLEIGVLDASNSQPTWA